MGFHEKLADLWSDIRGKQLREESVLLLILASHADQHLKALATLEPLLQFKDLHYVVIQDEHSEELRVEFLE